jgi:hypothetical protein
MALEQARGARPPRRHLVVGVALWEMLTGKLRRRRDRLQRWPPYFAPVEWDAAGQRRPPCAALRLPRSRSGEAPWHRRARSPRTLGTNLSRQLHPCRER